MSVILPLFPEVWFKTYHEHTITENEPILNIDRPTRKTEGSRELWMSKIHSAALPYKFNTEVKTSLSSIRRLSGHVLRSGDTPEF